MDPRPVGVFDSGVGGLTVLHECLVTMPHEDFVYLGDHARLPYGPRSRDEVRRFAHEIGTYLEHQGVKIVGPVNLAAELAYNASEMYARNLHNFLRPALVKGELVIDWNDEVFAGAVLTHDGAIRHEATRKAIEG